MNRNLQLVGIVLIGRNEGDRLRRCLVSARAQCEKVVYVDSGSTDGSVEYAASQNVHVVELDMSIPFNAGRARNEGFRYLTDAHPEIDFVQFIDGDCELCQGWLAFAYDYLVAHGTCAVVAGRRRERFPDRSIFNTLCDFEWNTAVGKAKATGGDFLVRKEAFLQVNGFNPTVVAAEEPEMCFRLRERNWSIYRLDYPMTMHDAHITKFSQWWKRTIRSGHGFAQGVVLHGTQSEHFFVKYTLSIWFWALFVPFAVLVLTFYFGLISLLVFALYPLQVIEIAVRARKQAGSWKVSFLHASFIVIGRWAQLIGQLYFIKRRLFGEKLAIIEYNRSL